MPPTISLVIPVLNAAATFERTLQSIFVQDYPELELILIDGGSTDGTLAIANRFADKFAVLVSEPDSGPANAINKGFARASGELYGWLGADDELLPGALSHCAGLFTEEPDLDFVIGGCERVYPNGMMVETRPSEKVFARIAYANEIDQPATLWRADLFKAVGGLDESFDYAFDLDLWNKFSRAGARSRLTSRSLARFHFSDGNLTSTGGTALVKEMARVLRRYGPYSGGLAAAWLLLYFVFDLQGCYDRPPSCGLRRQRWCWFCQRTFRRWFGAELIDSYNWHFASKQQRGLCWYL